jgi:23S rRNA U2552 (ribose-2'-O)-methylase RlmE/FtsJ
MGPEEPLLYQRMRGLFEKVARFKPEASRSESSESYLIGLGKKSEA